VETEAANDTWQSFQQRERVKIALPDTLADGMRNLMPGALTFPINLAHAKGIATVKEADLVAAMRFLFSRLKLVIEPTAAATVATFMTRAVDLRGRTGVAVLSGGNVDPALYARLLIESPT
jgi:threonine dehydratase